MKLLIVEDEPKTGEYIRRGLTEAGFVVDRADDGRDGLDLAMTGGYDLVILDVMLPGLSGWEILKALRAAGRALPVLFLTARDQIEDRVRGLELGADDYLVKPFAFAELLARVRTLLRRGKQAPAAEMLAIADLELDPVRRRVTRAGQVVRLTAREFSLLQFLLERVGEPVSRTRIVEAVWEHDFDTCSNVVDVYVRYLRKKIDEPFSYPLVHTVRGVGYTLRPGP